MAKAANKASVEAAHAGPDYEAALSIIEGRIASAKSAQSKASGEAGQAWASIEKMGIHKAGAQAAARVIAMDDDDDQQDWLRSFAKLLEAAGVSIQQDIVDMAEGKETKVVPVQKAKAKAKADVTEQSAQDRITDADLNGGAEEASVVEKAIADSEPPVQRARKGAAPRLSVVEAKTQSQKHLGTTVPDALH